MNPLRQLQDKHHRDHTKPIAFIDFCPFLTAGVHLAGGPDPTNSSSAHVTLLQQTWRGHTHSCKKHEVKTSQTQPL